MSTEPSQLVKIRLSEAEGQPEKEVALEILKHSNVLKNMLDDLEEGAEEEEPLNLPNIKDLAVWNKIQEYMEYMCQPAYPTSKRTGHIQEFTDIEKQYLNSMDFSMLKQVILTANFLTCNPLVEAGCKQVANMIKGKTPDEIRIMMGVSEEEKAPVAQSEAEQAIDSSEPDNNTIDK